MGEKVPTLPSLAASVNITILGGYLLFKRSALRFIIYTLPGGRLVRPYLLSLLRVNHVSASLILASFCASLASLLILEVANTLADVYFSQVRHDTQFEYARAKSCKSVACLRFRFLIGAQADATGWSTVSGPVYSGECPIVTGTALI